MNIVSEYSCSFGVLQRTRCVFWLVVRQETVIKKSVVTSDAQLREVLIMYAANIVEI